MIVRSRSRSKQRRPSPPPFDGSSSGLRARIQRSVPPGWPRRSWRRESTTVIEAMARRRHQRSPTSLAGGAREPATRSRAGPRFRRISAPRCPRTAQPDTCEETDIRLTRQLIAPVLELARQSPGISSPECTLLRHRPTVPNCTTGQSPADRPLFNSAQSRLDRPIYYRPQVFHR